MSENFCVSRWFLWDVNDFSLPLFVLNFIFAQLFRKLKLMLWQVPESFLAWAARCGRCHRMVLVILHILKRFFTFLFLIFLGLSWLTFAIIYVRVWVLILEVWRQWRRRVSGWRKLTFTMLCFFLSLLLGLYVPLVCLRRSWKSSLNSIAVFVLVVIHLWKSNVCFLGV